MIRFLTLAGLVIALASPLQARTFTYFNGRTVEAEFVSLVGNQVTLSIAGKPVVVMLGLFLAADQKFIRESAAGASPSAPAAVLALAAKVRTSAVPGMKPAAGTPDPRVKPGEKFFLEFPSLAPDRHGGPAKMEVRIPVRYDATRKYPLIIWMGGGDGGNTVGMCPALVDQDSFICAGLPYPKGANNPQKASIVGEFKKIWRYQHAMLEELYRVVPNLDSRLRIISGFSNGAHTIDGILNEARDYTDWFNCFILVDGGGRAERWPHKDNQFACVLWGENSMNKMSGENNIHLAKHARMTLMAEEMKGAGHEFAKPYVPKVREWIEKTVIPTALGVGK